MRLFFRRLFCVFENWRHGVRCGQWPVGATDNALVCWRYMEHFGEHGDWAPLPTRKK